VEKMFNLLKPMPVQPFGENKFPFVYHEIAFSPGEVQSSQYTHLGRPIEFRYLNAMQDVIKKRYAHSTLANLKDFGHMSGFLPDEDAVVIVDNHDVQRAANGVPRHVIMFRNYREHKQITAFMLAWPYGLPKIMSSYNWDEFIRDGKDINRWRGPPSYPNGTTKNVLIHNNGSCGDNWICEHRWRQMYNMVQFRNAVGEAPVTMWQDNGFNHIAFSRQGRGFFAMNNDAHNFDGRVRADLPAGEYCDVIAGELKNNACTGRTITVTADGWVQVFLDANADGVTNDPIMALHINAKIQ